MGRPKIIREPIEQSAQLFAKLMSTDLHNILDTDRLRREHGIHNTGKGCYFDCDINGKDLGTGSTSIIAKNRYVDE